MLAFIAVIFMQFTPETFEGVSAPQQATFQNKLSVLQKNTDWSPIKTRVNVQDETASSLQVIDGEWVAVGLEKSYAISRDTTLLPSGKVAYRFELRSGDNTIEGLYPGQKVARAELSYCYAVAEDYKSVISLQQAQRRKAVHYVGKGSCKQGAHKAHTFRVFIPDSMSSAANVIFAQWHSMPTRTLLADSIGNYLRPNEVGFADAEKRIVFKKGIGYENGKPNGWTVDHGGQPVLAFGFSSGYFYVKANSDRKWLTDVQERCDADVVSSVVMQPVFSSFKSSTIVCRMPWENFPKNRWVTFNINVCWPIFGREEETVKRPGNLSIEMQWEDGGKQYLCNLVQSTSICLGRNDEDGYYFKCGAYRQAGSDIPICYYIAEYKEYDLIKKE